MLLCTDLSKSSDLDQIYTSTKVSKSVSMIFNGPKNLKAMGEPPFFVDDRFGQPSMDPSCSMRLSLKICQANMICWLAMSIRKTGLLGFETSEKSMPKCEACEAWCWNIYLQNWAIFRVNV